MIRAGRETLRRHVLPLLIVSLVLLAAYGRIIGHRFVLSWDDYYYVTANSAIQGVTWEHIRTVFSSYYVGNYAPVQMLSYMFDHALWGMWPGGFLLTNLLLHLLNGLMVYRLFFLLHCDRCMALIGGAVFLLHPIQVESVAWVSQRKNVLAMFFFLLAWECYRRYRDGADRGMTAYAASLIAFACAGLSKSVVVIFPLVLVLYDVCFPPAPGRQRRWDKVPFFAIAAAIVLVAMASQQPDAVTWGGAAGGGMSGYHGGSPWATFLTMLTVMNSYLAMLVWPAKLSALYDHTVYREISVQVVAAAAVLAGAAGLFVYLFRRSSRLGFWPLFYLTALLPVAQIIPLVTLMNDRYLYFPMIGVAGIAGALGSRCCEWYGKAAWLPIVAIVLLLALLSSGRAAVWSDDISLWSDTVRKTPNRAEAWQNLALSLQASPDNRKREALEAFERSYALQPRDTTIYLMGTVYQDLGEYRNALAVFKTLLVRSPDNVMGLTALGNTHLLLGEFDEADRALQRAHALQPEAMQVVMFMGRLAAARGDWAQARSHFRQVEQEWQDPESALQLARVEAEDGRSGDALAWLEKALQRGCRDAGALNSRKDLAPLRGVAGFAALMQRYFPERAAR